MGIETMAVAALTLTAIGGGVAAVNTYEQGKAQKAINDRNAQIADQAALDKQRDSRIIANAQRARNRTLMSKQRALLAKSGVLAETGSPLALQAKQAGELELAALDAERSGNVEAAQLREQAIADRMAGRAARRAGNLGAAATILSTAGNVGFNYAYGRSSGMIGGGRG